MANLGGVECRAPGWSGRRRVCSGRDGQTERGLIAPLLIACAVLACAPGEPGPKDDVGAARLALATVPSDVACLEIVVAGSRVTKRLFPVSPGTTPTLTLQGLPLGPTTFSAQAFAAACDAIAGTQPTWTGDPVTVTLVVGVIADVRLVLHRPGRATVGIDFEDEPDAAVPIDVADTPPEPDTGTETPPDGGVCIARDEACDEGSACCIGACRTGTCQCVENGTAGCRKDDDCCYIGSVSTLLSGAVCSGGRCCAGLYARCIGSIFLPRDCCPGLSCRTLGRMSRACLATECALLHEACREPGPTSNNNSDECCGGHICVSGRCEAVPGPACTADSDCPIHRADRCDPQTQRCCAGDGQSCGGFPANIGCCSADHYCSNRVCVPIPTR